jgi:hypothetical protein
MEDRFYSKLMDRIAYAEQHLSAERESNVNNETFTRHKIRITSSRTANVTFLKSGGKFVLLFFYWQPAMNDFLYMIPSDADCLGLQYFLRDKLALENENFKTWESGLRS